MFPLNLYGHVDLDPASPDYTPLAQRPPLEQARWWALVSRRIGRRERALYSPAEDARVREVSFDLWRMLRENSHG